MTRAKVIPTQQTVPLMLCPHCLSFANQRTAFESKIQRGFAVCFGFGKETIAVDRVRYAVCELFGSLANAFETLSHEQARCRSFRKGIKASKIIWVFA